MIGDFSIDTGDGFTFKSNLTLTLEKVEDLLRFEKVKDLLRKAQKEKQAKGEYISLYDPENIKAAAQYIPHPFRPDSMKVAKAEMKAAVIDFLQTQIRQQREKIQSQSDDVRDAFGTLRSYAADLCLVTGFGQLDPFDPLIFATASQIIGLSREYLEAMEKRACTTSFPIIASSEPLPPPAL